MKTVLSRYSLNGVTCNAPINWQSLEVLSTFDNETVQANISTTELTFVLDEYQKIIDYIDKGKAGGVGIFEGLPIKMELYNDTNTLTSFDGLLDLSDSLIIDEAKHSVKAKVRLKNQLFTLEEKLTALSFEYLKNKGAITDNDLTEINYVVQKKVNIIEVIMLSLMIYLLAKELYENIQKLATQIADVASKIAIIPSGAIGAAIMSAAILILNAAYAVAIVYAIIKLSTTLLEQLIPIKRKAKVLNLNTALTKVCAYLGYGFNTNLTELQELYYLPSNQSYDDVDKSGAISLWKGAKKGFPQSVDYGYNCADFFEICKKRFNGKFAIVNNDVWFYTKEDDIWVKQSTFKLDKTLQEIQSKTYNTKDLIANKLFSFDVDFNDEKTTENFTGTNYEIITEPITINNKKEVYVRGLDEIRMGVCLGNRKDNISGFENLLLECAGIIDDITGVFGKGTNFKNKIKTQVGMLVVSSNQWTKPKLLKLNSALKLVERNSQSCQYIYENYYSKDSFVDNNWRGQKEIYNEIKIPFSLEKFLQVITNSYFYTSDGSVGKIIDLKYKFNNNYAIVSYWIRKPYTYNLKETKIESTNE